MALSGLAVTFQSSPFFLALVVLALLATEGVVLEFSDDAISEVARGEFFTNKKTQNQGIWP